MEASHDHASTLAESSSRSLYSWPSMVDGGGSYASGQTLAMASQFKLQTLAGSRVRQLYAVAKQLSEAEVQAIVNPEVQRVLDELTDQGDVLGGGEAARLKPLAVNAVKNKVRFEDDALTIPNLWKTEVAVRYYVRPRVREFVLANVVIRNTPNTNTIVLNGQNHTTRERTHRAVKGLHAGGDDLNIQTAVGKMDGKNNCSGNAGLRKLDNPAARLTGSHGSYGMGGTGCTLFFTEAGTTFTVVAIGHHVGDEHNYNIVWALDAGHLGRWRV